MGDSALVLEVTRTTSIWGKVSRVKGKIVEWVGGRWFVQASVPGRSDVEMPALDWDGHSKICSNTRLKANRFISNHKLLERCSFFK